MPSSGSLPHIKNISRRPAILKPKENCRFDHSLVPSRLGIAQMNLALLSLFRHFCSFLFASPYVGGLGGSALFGSFSLA